MSVPTVGIGASPACDGQILVTDDMLGLTPEPRPKFVKNYATLDAEITKAASLYAEEVRSRVFPADSNVYHGKTVKKAS